MDAIPAPSESAGARLPHVKECQGCGLRHPGRLACQVSTREGVQRPVMLGRKGCSRRFPVTRALGVPCRNFRTETRPVRWAGGGALTGRFLSQGLVLSGSDCSACQQVTCSLRPCRSVMATRQSDAPHSAQVAGCWGRCAALRPTGLSGESREGLGALGGGAGAEIAPCPPANPANSAKPTRFVADMAGAAPTISDRAACTSNSMAGPSVAGRAGAANPANPANQPFPFSTISRISGGRRSVFSQNRKPSQFDRLPSGASRE